VYSIAAATGGGARGVSADDLLVDEVREIDEDVVGAALPTVSASLNPQVVYASNAGHELSLVLNAIRERAGKDPSLAYLEWSAAPDRASDDREGWAEANPSLSHFPALMDVLERAHRSAALTGQMAVFETEHLCRWVPTMRQRLVDEASWALAEGELSAPTHRFMAVSMDPSGTRASAAEAWLGPDRVVSLRMTYDVPGSPIDTGMLGRSMKADARKHRVRKIGFDPMTDKELAKHFAATEPITGSTFANASAQFVNLVNAGRLRWQDCDAITADLVFTARKDHDESGAFQAVRANDERPITAVLAAIRAVWLASGPKTAKPRIY
jgi:phage terminase large subunit-like protein